MGSDLTGDMTGRICVVTGANRGIGRATAEGLARIGATVVMVCRRKEEGDAVAQKIGAKSSPAPDVVAADLSSQASIRKAAAELQRRYPRLHVLINNAGIIPQKREVTVDGLEMQFAVNHLAYFLLTNLLLPQLKAGAPSRIINVSSGAHTHADLDFADLQAERSYHPKAVYSRTKLANVLFTYELARRLRGTGVTVNTLTPGIIATRMLADYMGVSAKAANLRTFGATPEEGAETSIYLASAPELAEVTGKYFERKQATPSSRKSHDEALARRLWEVSERLTGLSS
jgi:NAD(P)-dependent dehydrogenase (short-subunit alcohol dehydrogenase family)